MRILLLNHAYFGGGAERCVRDLHEALTARGHEVHVWIAHAPKNQKLPDAVTPICNSWERFLRPLDLMADRTDWRHRGSIKKFSEIKAGDFDLIHMHHIGGGWLSLKALSQLCEKIPTVWTHHDLWAVTDGFIYELTELVTKKQVISQSRGLYRLLKRSPYHPNYKNSKVGSLLDQYMPTRPHMIAPSRYMLSLLEHCARFTNSNSQYIANGLKLLDEPAIEMNRAEARVSWGMNPHRPTLLMVAANLHDIHKGIGLGLQAIAQLQESIKPQVLILGRHAQVLESHLQGMDVTTAYAADNASLARGYRAADVTVIPSLLDNFPFVALESMACQTPVCAFAVGGLVEMLGDEERGMASEPYHVDAMASDIQTLLKDDEKRIAMGQAGKEWVTEQCEMNVFIEQIEHCYAQAIKTFSTAAKAHG